MSILPPEPTDEQLTAFEDAVIATQSFELTDSEKLDFLYQVAVKADKLMKDVGPQLIPMLEGIQKNPMLKMFLKS